MPIPGGEFYLLPSLRKRVYCLSYDRQISCGYCRATFQVACRAESSTYKAYEKKQYDKTPRSLRRGASFNYFFAPLRLGDAKHAYAEIALFA